MSSTISQPTAACPSGVSTTERDREASAGDRSCGALPQCSRDRDRTHREQVFQAKVQTDAEHQQDHTQFRKLRRDFGVADHAGRVGADYDTSNEITDNG
jgi:hypothetical protein